MCDDLPACLPRRHPDRSFLRPSRPPCPLLHLVASLYTRSCTSLSAIPLPRASPIRVAVQPTLVHSAQPTMARPQSVQYVHVAASRTEVPTPPLLLSRPPAPCPHALAKVDGCCAGGGRRYVGALGEAARRVLVSQELQVRARSYPESCITHTPSEALSRTLAHVGAQRMPTSSVPRSQARPRALSSLRLTAGPLALSLSLSLTHTHTLPVFLSLNLTFSCSPSLHCDLPRALILSLVRSPPR